MGWTQPNKLPIGALRGVLSDKGFHCLSVRLVRIFVYLDARRVHVGSQRALKKVRVIEKLSRLLFPLTLSFSSAFSCVSFVFFPFLAFLRKWIKVAVDREVHGPAA